MMFCLELGQN